MFIQTYLHFKAFLFYLLIVIVIREACKGSKLHCAFVALTLDGYLWFVVLSRA